MFYIYIKPFRLWQIKKFLCLYTSLKVLIYSFLHYLAVFVFATFEISFSSFKSCFLLNYLTSFYLHDCFLSLIIFLFFAYTLLLIFIVFKNLTSNLTTFLFAISFANLFFLVQPYQFIFFVLNLLKSFFFCFFYFWHFVYKYSTDYSAFLYHQYLSVFITPILTKNIPIAPYLVLS